MSRTATGRRRNPTLLVAHACCITLVLLVTGCAHKGSSADSGLPGDGWHEFHGIWTAAGSRNILQLGGDRRASISSISGSLVLAGPSRPDVGFRSQAVVFNDSTTGMVGRAVWTDEKGDQVFSELRGEGTSGQNKITGTFVGGTGRYAGATGTYEFSWRFLIENEDGVVQGQSIGLSGRVRAGSPQTVSALGGPRL